MGVPTSLSHPLLHPDILPNIILACDERTVARLMRVSRSILSTVVEMRYPYIILDPGSRRKAIKTRTDLPTNSRWFSTDFTVYLSLYARTVRVLQHPPYLCPPRMVRTEQKARARILVVDGSGMCRPGLIGVPGKVFFGVEDKNDGSLGRDGSKAGSESSTCAIGRMFEPTTVRIDDWYASMPFPSGLHFGPTVSRLVLYNNATISNAVTRQSRHSDELSVIMIRRLPAHISEISLILPRLEPSQDEGLDQVIKQVETLASWIGARGNLDQNQTVVKSLVIVGPEILDDWLEEMAGKRKGEILEGKRRKMMPQDARIMQIHLENTERGSTKSGQEILSEQIRGVLNHAIGSDDPLDDLRQFRSGTRSVRFIPLERYLVTSEAKAENTEEEMAAMRNVVWKGWKKRSKKTEIDPGGGH